MARAGTSDRLAARAAVGAIAIYRAAISPVIHALNGPACRFEPSCSAYARDAIAQYGALRGGAMALWRIARCNPMGGQGYDPVAGVTPGRGDGDAVLRPRSVVARGQALTPAPNVRKRCGAKAC